MTDSITFTLDGRKVEARSGETIWEVAKRNGTLIPHLCHADQPGYRPDGNCRACMVEISGEGALAASCIRMPTDGMTVTTGSERAAKARKTVIEMLASDQPEPGAAHDKSSHFWDMAELAGVQERRFPKLESERVPLLDNSHVAMHVNLDACIHCNLCVRACRDVQVNDVIGLAYRGHDAKIVFDLDDPMGESTCVACGECVQACPTGALTPATLGDTKDRGAIDKEVNSVCPYCGVGCQITYKIKEGRIKFVDGRDGPANEQRLCVKGRFGFDYVSHPHRLTKPLIRREGLKKDLDVDPADPSTHFREATWEEAIRVAAAGLDRIKHDRGGGAIAGFGSAKCSNEEAYLFQKLIREAFGHNNVDHCTRLCHASSVAALIENVGSGAVTATFNEIRNSDVAILIGCNPAGNHPVAATYFKQFAKRGGKLITMDPRKTGMSGYAWRDLQFKAGSDVALLNAIMHAIIDEELHDEAYIASRTENFNELREHLKTFTPESTEPLTGIDPTVVREVARAFATAGAAMIFWGMGISQHTHGTDNSRCLISLALMCGQVGRPGTGLHPLRGQNNVQGASDAGLIPMVMPDYEPVGRERTAEKYRKLWGVEIDPEPGLTVVEIIEAVHEGRISGMYILGENPAMSDPDLKHARGALATLEHLVVQDLFLTETACYADVVLPASAWPEKTGTVTNTNRQVQMGRKALNPPGEAREDWSITVDLAKQLGLDWNYEHPMEVFAEMKLAMGSLDNITWDRLEAENAVTYPSLSPDDPGQPVVFGDGFPRSGGRARFTPAHFTPPAEEPSDEFPLILSTGRVLEHWHTGSMTRRSEVLDAVEPEASASINPSTLADLGIEAGEQINVSTRRGHIEIMAREDSRVAEGSIYIPFAFVESAVNILTNPELDPFGKIPEFKFCAARIDKTAESPPSRIDDARADQLAAAQDGFQARPSPHSGLRAEIQ